MSTPTSIRPPPARDHPTGAQIRAARGLLNLSVAQLAERTRLGVNTIKRAEATNEAAPITAAIAQLIVSALEEAGVKFIPAEGDAGAGVRFATLEAERGTYRSRRRG